MSQDRTILRQQMGVIPSDSEKPGMMARQRGTLLLTPQRIIWIKGTGGVRD